MILKDKVKTQNEKLTYFQERSSLHVFLLNSYLFQTNFSYVSVQSQEQSYAFPVLKIQPLFAAKIKAEKYYQIRLNIFSSNEDITFPQNFTLLHSTNKPK